MVLAGLGFLLFMFLLVAYELWKEKQGDEDDRD
jgi:hypothetical protein